MLFPQSSLQFGDTLAQSVDFALHRRDCSVLIGSDDAQVLRPVVCSLAVDMVNVFPGLKESSEGLRRDKAVLKDLAPSALAADFSHPNLRVVWWYADHSVAVPSVMPSLPSGVVWPREIRSPALPAETSRGLGLGNLQRSAIATPADDIDAVGYAALAWCLDSKPIDLGSAF